MQIVLHGQRHRRPPVVPAGLSPAMGVQCCSEKRYQYIHFYISYKFLYKITGIRKNANAEKHFVRNSPVFHIRGENLHFSHFFQEEKVFFEKVGTAFAKYRSAV